MCPEPLWFCSLISACLLFFYVFLLLLSRTVLPLPTRTTGGGGFEVKTCPLVSEVRPLHQNLTQETRVSWDQNTTTKQNQGQRVLLQDQVPEQDRTNLDQTEPPQPRNQIQQTEEDETSSAQQTHRAAPLKKKVQTAVDPRRNQGPVARAAASYLSSSSGLRKAQSVQSLLIDPGNSPHLPGKEQGPDCGLVSRDSRLDLKLVSLDFGPECRLDLRLETKTLWNQV